MAQRLAVGNSKGGVGKSTTTIGLAVAARNAGQRVLVVDGDPQANTTRHLSGLRADHELPTWSDVLSGAAKAKDSVLDVSASPLLGLDQDTRDTWTGLKLMPSARRSAGVENGLPPEDVWAGRDMLDALQEDYDLIIIDCPPQLGMITLVHLYASDQVVVVTTADGFSADGVEEFGKTIQKVNRSSQLSVAGVVLNLYDQREASQQRLGRDLQDQLGDRLLSPWIPARAVIRRAKDFNRPPQAMPGPEAADVARLYTALFDQLHKVS